MLEVVQAQLGAGVAEGVFPGAQAAVRAAGMAVDALAGRTALVGPSAPVASTTLFDIASLTKALCTSVLLMQALESEALRLEDRVNRWFPALEAADRISVRLLACHRAGLAAHRPFYETLLAEGAAGTAGARDRMQSLVVAEPLQSRPDAVCRYSDLGYLLLGWILEAALGAPLDALFAERVAGPLGLERTRFGPVEPEDVAATELDGEGVPLRGVVHDENTRAMGGIAGHAGLFSTAAEVAALVEHLARAHRGAPGIVRTETVRRFWRRVAGGDFTLGWDTPTEPSSSGRYTTRGAAVGHLGFTGCSVWHDIAREVTIVLLSNRVHPTRANEAIRQFRPAFHDAVNEALW